MSPFERAAGVYDIEYSPRTFDHDFILHLRHGYVIANERTFLMGRPICKDADSNLIFDPSHKFASPDCWLVWLAAGELQAFFQFMPYYLPWVGWERDNVFRTYPTEKVKRLIHGNTLVTSTTSGGTDRIIVPHRSAA